MLKIFPFRVVKDAERDSLRVSKCVANSKFDFCDESCLYLRAVNWTLPLKDYEKEIEFNQAEGLFFEVQWHCRIY